MYEMILRYAKTLDQTLQTARLVIRHRREKECRDASNSASGQGFWVTHN
jgi:hypothetical protein